MSNMKLDALTKAKLEISKCEENLVDARDFLAVARKRMGDELRRQRKARRLSLREVAVRLDISAPFLSDCELGRRWLNDDLLADYISMLRNQP